VNLTEENYFSPVAHAEYMSASSYNGWMECGARQAAVETGRHKVESDAMLAGTICHCAVLEPHKLPELLEQNAAAIGKRGGGYRAPFEQALEMAVRITTSPGFARLFAGCQYEQIVTGLLGGTKWKGKLDAVNRSLGYFYDLKTTADFAPCWTRKDGRNVQVPWYGRYWPQMAIYWHLTGGLLPVIIGVSKQVPAGLQVVEFGEDRLAAELEIVRQNLPTVLRRKAGEEQHACGCCDWCRGAQTLETALKSAVVAE
jgi:hypothetical protein